jgi:3-oxoadipate enol-lactonase
MPRIKINGVDLYYETHGEAGGETIVFAHGLLWSGWLFARQVAALAGRYRCVTFDFRGHGRSAVTRNGYDMESLAEDAAALIEVLGCSPCHFLGLSMGGFIGMRLAIRRPELLRSLLLLNTSADPEPEENLGRYRLLALVNRCLGTRAVARPVMEILFAKKFLADPARAALRDECRRRMIANHRIGVARAVKGVITRRGVYDQLDRVAVPTLILAGGQDRATVPAKSERIHARIAGSTLRVISGAGHTSTIEEPAAVNQAIEEFLAGLGQGQGVERRRL